MGSENFEWVGDCVPTQRRKYYQLHYKGFSYGHLNVRIDDYVLVHNDDSLDPEENSFIAQVKDLYEADDEYDSPYRAVVQWFSRISEVPPNFVKQLKDVDYKREIFREGRSHWSNVIDCETIFGKCSVIYLPEIVSPKIAIAMCELHRNEHIYFCRWEFTGRSFLCVETANKSAIKKAIKESSKKNADLTNSKVRTDDKVSLSASKNSGGSTHTDAGTSSTRGKRWPRKSGLTPAARSSLTKNAGTSSPRGKRWPRKSALIPPARSSLTKSPAASPPSGRRRQKKSALNSDAICPLVECPVSPKEVQTNVKKLVSFITNELKDVHLSKTPVKSRKRDIDCQIDESFSDTQSPHADKILDHSYENGSISENEKSPVKRFRTQKFDSGCDKDNSHHLDHCISPSLDTNVKESNLQTTPVKRFYSPRKKHSRILSNSPYFKQFQDSHGNDIDHGGAELDILCQFTSPRGSRKAKFSFNEKSKSCDQLNKTQGTFVKRSLFQDSDDGHSVRKEESSHVQSHSVSSSDVDNKCENRRVSRYGRTVTPKYSYVDPDNTPRKDSPKQQQKKSFVENSSSCTKKRVSYVLDFSDNESAYTPSASSSDDESSSKESDPEPKFQKVSRSGGKSSSKKSRRTSVAPSIPERCEPLKTPQNILEVSRQRLHVSAIPKSLPCREDEYADIYTFVESNLTNGTGGCMYISGVPGTGKTATVFEVMRNLQDDRDHGHIPPFKFVDINGMRMTDPQQSYVLIYKSLMGETVAPQQAADLLEKHFTKRRAQKEAVVLVVDELDLLWTRKQTVMYNIFDWPSRSHSKLIVIAIANAMDLPERLLMSRISSRLGLTRKTFQPYTFKQLQEIVMCRIQEFETFDPDAVQLVARKVAAVSGDARRALDICRRATEIAEERKIPISPKKGSKILVGIGHVDLALQEMFTSPMMMAIRSSSDLQKMLLRGVVAEFQRTGLEEAVFSKTYRQLVSLCRFEGIRPPNTSQAYAACAHLASSHVLLVDSSENDLYQKIRLNTSVDDVTYALSERSI